MWKALLAGTTALVIAGSSLVYAQQGPMGSGQGMGPGGAQGWRPSTEDMNVLTDARMAEIKTALKLTSDQEKNWPPVEQALRDLAKQRIDRITARRNGPRTDDAIERLRHRADAMTATAAGLKRLADAAQPLYQSLDEGQKHRLMFVVRAMRGEHMAHMGGGWRRHGGQGPGQGGRL
ncbi:MAG TPA: Spy/CpxP family protein refolding chaperone [Xanthobacteraceae bacterium]|jgi:hypothetical protein|nr:Spy/CpxP family protein refolding chaperone [Xanthobacteraceae bacterium]